MVPKRRLGLSDIEVTPIGVGCAQMAATGIAAGVRRSRVRPNPSTRSRALERRHFGSRTQRAPPPR